MGTSVNTTVNSPGCETESFGECEWGLLPLLQRNDGGEGWGEEAGFIGKPLSLTLSPFVPHGERESVSRKSVYVVVFFSSEKPMRKPSRRILSYTRSLFPRRWTPHLSGVGFSPLIALDYAPDPLDARVRLTIPLRTEGAPS